MTPHAHDERTGPRTRLISAGQTTGDGAHRAPGLPQNGAETAGLAGIERRLISIVIPCYNEEAVLPYLVSELRGLAETLEPEYETEFVLVDDGSQDSTWLQLLEIAAADSRFRGARLSRNFGHQPALRCAYSLARGDAIISMDADLQDPPEVVPELICRWRAGADIVHGVRDTRLGESAFKLATAKGFYRLMALLGIGHIKEQCGDFRLMSRRSLDALLSLNEQHQFIRGMVGWIGFPRAEVRHVRRPRQAGVTKYPLIKMLRFAMDGVISFSRAPLKLAYYAAALLAFFFGLLCLVPAVDYFFDSGWQPSWGSALFAVTCFGSLILLSQAFMGEYVARIYEQSKQRPLFIVQELTPHVAAHTGNLPRPPIERTLQPKVCDQIPVAAT